MGEVDLAAVSSGVIATEHAKADLAEIMVTIPVSSNQTSRRTASCC